MLKRMIEKNDYRNPKDNSYNKEEFFKEYNFAKKKKREISDFQRRYNDPIRQDYPIDKENLEKSKRKMNKETVDYFRQNMPKQERAHVIVRYKSTDIFNLKNNNNNSNKIPENSKQNINKQQLPSKYFDCNNSKSLKNYMETRTSNPKKKGGIKIVNKREDSMTKYLQYNNKNKGNICFSGLQRFKSKKDENTFSTIFPNKNEKSFETRKYMYLPDRFENMHKDHVGSLIENSNINKNDKRNDKRYEITEKPNNIQFNELYKSLMRKPRFESTFCVEK